MIGRRRFLQAAALPVLGWIAGATGAAGLTTSGVKPAAAFAFEEAADDVSGQYLRARECLRAPNAYHEQLVTEVRAMLRARDVAVSEAEIRLAVAQTTCPLCGCALES